MKRVAIKRSGDKKSGDDESNDEVEEQVEAMTAEQVEFIERF